MKVQLTSADPAGSLAFLGERGMVLTRLEWEDELTVSFRIPERDWKTLARLCRGRGDRVVILSRGQPSGRRPVLILGLLALLALNLFLPSRILFLRVEGNETVPQRKILEAAERCGLGFGASRRSTRSEAVKNALLEAVPELQWAGVNTSGCTAVISVRERSPGNEAVSPGTSLTASRDGYLLCVHVTRGTALVKPGEIVRAGQTLVSGYTDCGLCIRATGAAGEVFARTKRDFRAVTPAKALRLEETGEVRRAYSLLFQKKRINLWKDSGISDASCGRMDTEYHITLPGGFRLPLALCVEAYPRRTGRSWELARPEAESALKQFSEDCLKGQMVSGELLSRWETVLRTESLFCLEGRYDCREMIGRVKEIGETNGKRD